MIYDSSFRSEKSVGRICFREKIELFARGLQSKPQFSSYILSTIDGNTRSPNFSAHSSLFHDIFFWNDDTARFDQFLVRVNGHVSLCRQTANDIVRIDITSWRICAKSFRRLEVSAPNQSTLILRRNRVHNRYLFADVRFCPYRPITSDGSRSLLR